MNLAVYFNMAIKRKDFQKAAAFIHEFLLKLSVEVECAELRDTLNLALLHMQKYYRTLRLRTQSQDRACSQMLSASLRGLSPLTPFKDAPDKFNWKWINLESPKVTGSLPIDGGKNLLTLPLVIQAAKQGDNELMQQLIQKDGSCVNEVDSLGRSPLMYAVHFNQLQTVHLLVQSGCDVNHVAHDGSTALHRACHDGHSEIVKMFQRSKADLALQDSQGRAPIHWACTLPSKNCLRLLLEQGVDVGVQDKEGGTPCMWACRMDNIEHFEMLSSSVAGQFDGGEEGLERDYSGKTWMHWSVRRTEPLECLQTLLTKDSAEIKDDEGKTVMLMAAEQGSIPACKLIHEIAGKSCIHDKDDQERTPLHLATMGGHGEVVNFLLEKGADINTVDKFNASARDYARARNLHYCSLILASYDRQRGRSRSETNEDSRGVNTPRSPNNNHLSIPISSPHPPPGSPQKLPSEPPTPRRPPSAPVGSEAPGRSEVTTREVASAGHERTRPDTQQDSEEEEEHPQGGPVEAFVSDMGERVMSLEGLEAQLDDDVEEEKEEEEEIQPENIPHESPSDQQQAQQQPPQDEDEADYLEVPEEELEDQSLSIGGMDVSDMEGERENEEEEEAEVVDEEGQRITGIHLVPPQQHPTGVSSPRHPPHPPAAQGYTQPLEPEYHHQEYIETPASPESREQGGGVPSPYPPSSPRVPTPPTPPSPQAPQTPESPPSLPGPPSLGGGIPLGPIAPSGGQSLPPPLLTPLTPGLLHPNKGKKDKKKKKKKKGLGGGPGELPPARGYVAPVQPPPMGLRAPPMMGNSFGPPKPAMSPRTNDRFQHDLRLSSSGEFDEPMRPSAPIPPASPRDSGSKKSQMAPSLQRMESEENLYILGDSDGSPLGSPEEEEAPGQGQRFEGQGQRFEGQGQRFEGQGQRFEGQSQGQRFGPHLSPPPHAGPFHQGLGPPSHKGPPPHQLPYEGPPHGSSSPRLNRGQMAHPQDPSPRGMKSPPQSPRVGMQRPKTPMHSPRTGPAAPIPSPRHGPGHKGPPPPINGRPQPPKGRPVPY